MIAIAERFRSLAPAILGVMRLLAGTMFACHGAQKLLGAFGGMPTGVVLTPIIILAGVLELGGGTLIALGLFTRGTAFTLSGMMAVAYFTGHAPNGFWPKANGGELAILYCWFFLYVAAEGAGAGALDNLRRPPRPS